MVTAALPDVNRRATPVRLDLLASGSVPIDEIISARSDFEHSAEAFTASADPEQVKVVVTVGSPS